MSAVILGRIQEAGAVLNNGFETDYVYVTRDIAQGGQLRVYRELDGTQVADLLPDGTNWETLTFAGTGGDDARLFVAKVVDNDVQVAEIDSAGGTVNSANLSNIIGGTVGTAPYMGNMRYSSVSNSLFIGLNPAPASTGPAVAYEIDLGLTTRLHTYVGPNCPSGDPRQVGIAINSRNGTLYMISRGLGGTLHQGDLVAFSTAGRPVGGTTSAYTTLIDGPTYYAVDNRYLDPNNVVYRWREGTGSDDTLIICPNPTSSARAALEFWLDTTAHPSGNPNYLALRGTQIAMPRGWNGQQDNVTGAIWIAAIRGGFHVIRSDDSSASYETGRNWTDAASPFSPAPQAPVIAEVTPDPRMIPAGIPYVQQLSLVAGTPAPTWSILQGPPGAQVDSTGKVAGWTPSAGDMGRTFTFEVQATNSAGSDTETWQVKVLQTNNGFINDYVFVVRSPNNGGQLRMYNRSDGVQVADLLPDGTNWMTATFSGKGRGDDARLFVAKLVGYPPENPPPAMGSTGTDIVLAELDYSGATLKTANLSTIIGGSVGPAVAVGNLRYSSVSNTLFLGLNPNVYASTAAVAYEIDLGLTARIHTYVGQAVGVDAVDPAFNGRVAVAVNQRDGTLYMTSQNMGDATGAGLGDVIAFDTAGRALGGITSAYTVLIDGQSRNAADANYVQPGSPIYRKRAGGDDTLLILTNTSQNTTVLEFYLNTTLHPKDADGNLAQRVDNLTPLSVGRGWHGQQEPGSGEVWLGAFHYGFHLIAADDAWASYQYANPGRSWLDAAVPPFVPCNAPPADMDGDGDVDQADFAVFQACFTGVGAPYGGLSQTCACVDLGDDNNDRLPDQDGDIDGFDRTAFENCASGPGIPANPTCGE